MFCRSRVCSMLIAVCLLMSLAGCGPGSRVALNLTPADTATYKVSTQTIKDFRFEQPSLTPPKVKEEQSGTFVQVAFVQKIDEVRQDGAALATITIKDVAYLVKEKNDVRFDFDSAREADKTKDFAKVIGQSYKIRILPDGKIEVVDAKDAAVVAIAGYEGQVAKAMFTDEHIRQRHEVLALPSEKNTLRPGDSWSTVVASPPGLLVSKSFRKTYTLTDVEGPRDNRAATIAMTAEESAEPVADASAKPATMGLFANLFDTKEVYTGNMVLELGAGKIRHYDEKLVATYMAAEDPPGGASDKGPDTLMMRFTYSVTRELLD